MQCAVIWPGGGGGGVDHYQEAGALLQEPIIQSRRFELLTRLKVMGNKIGSWRKRERKKEHACLPRAPRFFLTPI